VDNLKNKAMLEVLKEIRDMASGLMQDDIKSKGLKKVSVAADSKEGLEEGLDKAKEMLGKHDLMSALSDSDAERAEEEMEDPEEEASETPEEEDAEETPDSIEEQIKALQDKKHKLMLK
jgi:hypothetical protein